MNGHNKLEPLFPLGQVVATPGALAALETAGQAPYEFLVRHVCGEWGDLVEEDIRENERALQRGDRLFIPMFHPAAALHQPRYRSLIEEDFLKIPGILAEMADIEDESGIQGEQLSLF